MATYTQTGNARSLSVRIKNEITGITTTYHGYNTFSFNLDGQTHIWPAIAPSLVASMSKSAFDDRLNDFKRYLEIIIPGLNFSTGTIKEAYLERVDSCEIGKVVS
ncbi:MAG: hypothetical protein LBL07_18625 [Tannerella sp.]|jgi:hypothetical protein|nr:hypothetical protein [Tannerella sp.]